MKKLFMFLALVLGVVSCQTEPEGFDVNMGGEQEVLINVSLPDETRADSAEGGITNVIASDKYTIRYIFQVYNAEGKVSKNPVYEYTDDTSVSFPVRLVPGRDYRFVVWADIVEKNTKADLHYNTENFPDISLNLTWAAMDETRDAYTVSELVEDFDSRKAITLTLKRPLAKLRVITTDMAELLGLKPVSATVTYSTSHYNTFDALNSVVGDNKISGCEHANYTIKGDYETTNGKVLFTDYFFADNEVVNFHMSVKMSDGEAVNRSFTTDIPVKRNYLTTIKGDILTDGNNIVVNVEEGFDGKSDFPYYAGLEPASNEIWYTSTDGKGVTPNKTNAFGANIVSNSYDVNKECWVIKFDGDVTKIGSVAFDECHNLASIIIPDSVTSIGLWAFLGCHNLTSVTIPDSLTTFGDYIFSGCDNLQEFKGKHASGDGRCWIVDGVIIFFAPAGLTEYAIPNNATKIRTTAFSGCDSLTSVNIPDSVTAIGAYAFSSCYGLTSVTVPESVTTIGIGAFCNCSSLQEFNGKFASEDGRCLIVDGVLNSFAIGCGATEYTIPDSVTTIGNYAFEYCRSLTSVTIPDSVTTIGNYAFEYCRSLTSVTIPNSVTTIGDSAFYVCSSLTSVTIPDSVTTIENSAFAICHSLTNVTIGENVTYIGFSAFQLCESLTSVYCKATTPPAGASTMFVNNASGRKIYVPMESVEAYKSAEGWKSYADDIIAYNFETGEVVPEPAKNEIWYVATQKIDKTDWTSDTFGANIISHEWDSVSGEGVITFDGDVTQIGKNAFYRCEMLTNIIIPHSVTTIGSQAFGCSGLTYIRIPNSVSKIEERAFYCCYNLEKFTGKYAEDNGRCLIVDGVFINFAYACGTTEYSIPNNVTKIGDAAFQACKVLTTVNIPDSVTSIGMQAFWMCDGLTEVVIPQNVNKVRAWSFMGCHNMNKVYCKPMLPPSITYSNLLTWVAFSSQTPDRKIYVPMESVEAYKSAEGWSSYADAIEGYNF